MYFGWYGFNSGSTLSIVGQAESVVVRVVTTTTLSASCGALSTFFLYPLFNNLWFDHSFKIDIEDLNVCDITNGLLAGLTSVTANSDSVHPWFAMLEGALGGIIYSLVSISLKKIRIDDPLDAFAVHGCCGL